MADSNQDSERDPRFSRALLGRILAVGLFVALGTFAVIQLMSGSKKIDQTASLDADGNPIVVTADASASIVDPNFKSQPQIDTAGLKTSPASAPINSASMFDNSSITPPSSPPPRAANSQSFNPNFGNNPATAPKQPNFEPNKSSGPIVAPAMATANKPPTQPNTAPPSSPPNRFAQLPNNGPPIIGSNNGFGERPKSPSDNAPPTNPAAAFNAAANNTANKAAEGANAFGNNLANSANKLLNEAKQGTGNAAANLPAKLPDFAIKQSPTQPPTQPATVNGFGTAAASPFAPQTNQPKSEPPKSFDPPSNPKPFNPVPPLRTTGPGPGDNPPTMTAPTPSTAGFDPNRNLRPLGNGFADGSSNNNNSNSNSNSNSSRLQPIVVKDNDKATTPNNDRLNGINQSSSIPSTPSQSNFPAGNDRPRIPAQPASTPLGPAPGSPPTRLAAGPPRTTNVPGDRQLEGVQAPSLVVEKLSPREIQVNLPADFEVVVRNVGRAVAEDVQVHDQIPAGTDFLGSTPEPIANSADRHLQWNLGELKPGQEKRIKLQLKPVQPGEIGSVAHVTFATQASMRTLVTKPILEIVHQSKPTVLIGGDVLLDVVVANKGDGAALDVLIQEDVPEQLQYQGGFRDLEYQIGTLMPGQSKRVQLGLKAAQIGRVKNLILASAAGGLRASHEIDLEIIAPRLTTVSDGPTRRFLNREVTHQFKIGNQGTAPATNLDLIARLPAGLRFVSANNQGKYNPSSHAVFWSIAELGRDVNAAVELVTMPVSVGQQDIKFEAVADLDQKSATVQELSVEHLIDVFFDIDDVVDPIEIGADTSYKIRVVNQGTQVATNVQLMVEFPNGLAPTTVEGSLQNQIQGQRVNFAPISSLKPGDQLEVLVRAKGNAAGDHRIVVNMQADGRQTLVSKEETTRVYADR